MKSNDFYNDMSVDEILNDIKKMTEDEETPSRIWSMDEIDALISDDIDKLDEQPKTQENIDDILKELGIEGLEDEEGFSVSDVSELDDEPEEEETGFVVNSGDFKEDVAPLLDSTIAESEEHIEPQEASYNEEEVPGQLTIEKTRIFNEVQTRAIRNESIEHNIGKSKIIRTGEIPKGGMEKDPYRERFLNKPKLQIEKTQDHINLIKDLPRQTVEKHGVVIKKPEDKKTGKDGLSPVPLLVDAVDEYEAQQRLEAQVQLGVVKSSDMNEELENQIVLDGFDSVDEVVNIVSEAEEEAKLRKIRKDRASKFKLFPNLDYDIADEGIDFEKIENDEAPVLEEQEGLTKKVSIPSLEAEESIDEDEAREALHESKEDEVPEIQREQIRVAREFFGPKDAKAVHGIFSKELGQAKLRLISSIAGLIVLLICSVIASMFSNFAVFGNSPYVYSALNLIVLIAIAFVNIKSFTQAADGIGKKKINSSSALCLSLILGILQCLVSFAYGELVLSGMHIYSAVALFPVMLINLGEYIKLENDFTNFVLLNNKRGSFYAIKNIDDEDVAFEVGRGLMIKEPDIRYRAKVDFPYKFVEMSRCVDPSADMFKLVTPVALGAAVVVAIVSTIIYRNLFVGISALTGVYLMSVPAGAFVSMLSGLREANKRLNSENGMISGYEAVEDALNTNAVVVDSADMFSSDKTNIYGIKLFNSMRIDEAILYTAAVVIQSNGALSGVFDSIIDNRDMLPSVDSLAYEEKLGCSGWIYNYRVLVGNRDLLVKHNVEVQSKEEEKKYTKGKKQVIYLAVEGKVAAMFVVGYGADEGIAHYFRMLEKAGINILVKTSDANITEELIEQYFGLPRNYIKVISPVAGVMFKEYSEKEIKKEPCRILSENGLKSSLRAFIAAININEQKRISTVLQYVGVGIGIILMALFAFISGLTQAGTLQMILFESLWSIIVVFIPQLAKKI